MKKNLTILLCIFSFLVESVSAQKRTNFDSSNVQGVKADSAFKYIRFIPGYYSAMEIDVLDNVYLITAGNQLKKINANGDSAGVYNDVKKFGNPAFIDVSNPLKILVYYKNFSTVVILDRFLTFRNSINFRKENIFRVKALSTSYDNNIWIYDEQDQKLKKIDDDGKLLSETSDFRQLFDDVPQPALISDRDNFVYLYDPEKGFYVFDYYGSFKNSLPFLHWEHTVVANGKLYGFVNEQLNSYTLNSLDLKTYSLPKAFSDYSDIKAVNGKIYLLKKEGVEIYNLR